MEWDLVCVCQCVQYWNANMPHIISCRNIKYVKVWNDQNMALVQTMHWPIRYPICYGLLICYRKLHSRSRPNAIWFDWFLTGTEMDIFGVCAPSPNILCGYNNHLYTCILFVSVIPHISMRNG